MFHSGSYFSTNARHGKLVAKKGFTLIELVISLLIISAAVVTVLPNLKSGSTDVCASKNYRHSNTISSKFVK